MIYDRLSNLGIYSGLGEYIAKIADFVKKFKQEDMADGRYELDGDNLFCTISSYKTGPDEEKLYEAHFKYADLQLVIGGSERIYIANVNALTEVKPCPEGGDIAFYAVIDGCPVDLYDGDFVLLYPEDAHRPCCTTPGGSDVRKMVFKILVK